MVRSDDEFQAKIEPLRLAILDVVAKTVQLRKEANYLPAVDSLAMAELADEHRYAGAWGIQAVTDAHSMSWLLLAAAEDMIGSLSTLLTNPPHPVYGHLVLGRAIIESCARAAWLAEPDIAARHRVARCETERLHSAAEKAKLPGAPPTTCANGSSMKPTASISSGSPARDSPHPVSNNPARAALR